MKYDWYIAGRWRNKDNISLILETVRSTRQTTYCFIENEYAGEKIEFKIDGNPEEFMADMERLSQDDPMTRKIFRTDIEAERNSENFLLVLPAGISGHIEAGIAYGMGKKCYALGRPEKTESLYLIFDKIFASIYELETFLKDKNV